MKTEKRKYFVQSQVSIYKKLQLNIFNTCV